MTSQRARSSQQRTKATDRTNFLHSSCGYYHSAFVTDAGHLYMFGDCEGGKLGVGKEDLDDSPCDEPVKVSFPREAEEDLDDDDVETTNGNQTLDKVGLLLPTSQDKPILFTPSCVS